MSTDSSIPQAPEHLKPGRDLDAVIERRIFGSNTSRPGRFSTNEEMAFFLIEHVCSVTGLSFKICGRTGQIGVAFFEQLVGDDLFAVVRDPVYSAVATTMAHAACLAALKATDGVK